MKPVSRTAFYCCGVRMTDAASPRPVCGDTYAKRFMSTEALHVYDSLKADRHAVMSNVVRHRLIDDYLRDVLGRHPSRLIVTVGAGFDSRPYRIPLGR